MYQKSRQRWNKEGDQNNKFLYNAMKARFTKNYIASLDTNVCSVEQVNEVKVEIRKQFTNQFKDDRISRINTNVPFFIVSLRRRVKSWKSLFQMKNQGGSVEL